MLSDCEAAPLDEAIDDELKDYVERTKSGMPDAWY